VLFFSFVIMFTMCESASQLQKGNIRVWQLVQKDIIVTAKDCDVNSVYPPSVLD